MLLFVLLFVIFLLLIHLIFNYNHKARVLKKIPAPPSRFIFGNAFEVLVSPEEFYRKGRVWASQFNGIYSFYAYPLATVNIYNAEDVEVITSSMKYHKKGFVYNYLKPWLREGLLVSNGAKWQERRKILTNAFHFNVLQKYYPIIKDNDKLLIETLKQSNGEAVDVKSVVIEYTLNTICETAMGTKLSDDSTGVGYTYKNTIHELGKTLVYRIKYVSILTKDFIFNLTSTGRKQLKCLSVIHEITQNIIKKRRQALDNEIEKEAINTIDKSLVLRKKKRCVMLDLLLLAEKHNMIDAEGIQEEVDTFMFEGHDTTASALAHCLLLLANDQASQDKIETELNQIFGEDDRDADMSDLSSMQYLECCIKETMRLYPPVHFINRVIPEDIKLSNYTIPANTNINILINDLHRREDVFKNANEFHPERFLPENSVGRHTYAYIPFSAGPRNCIGQKLAMIEMLSVLSSILRKFKLVPVTKEGDLHFSAEIIMRSIEPIYIKFIEKKINHSLSETS